MVNDGSGWVDIADLHIQLCVYARDYICELSGRNANSSEEGDSIMCSRSVLFWGFFFRRRQKTRN